MFAKARLANLTIPELERSRAAVLNTLASAPIASVPPVRHRTVHRMVFRDSHPCGKLSAIWGARFWMGISLITHYPGKKATRWGCNEFHDLSDGVSATFTK